MANSKRDAATCVRLWMRVVLRPELEVAVSRPYNGFVASLLPFKKLGICFSSAWVSAAMFILAREVAYGPRSCSFMLSGIARIGDVLRVCELAERFAT